MHNNGSSLVLPVDLLFLDIILCLCFNDLVKMLEVLKDISIGPNTVHSDCSIEPHSHIELPEEEVCLSFF